MIKITFEPLSMFRQTPSVPEIITTRRILLSYLGGGVVVRVCGTRSGKGKERGLFFIVPLSFYPSPPLFLSLCLSSSVPSALNAS